MSAIGTKRTCASALQMSAFGGKADIEVKGFYCPLLTQSGHRLEFKLRQRRGLHPLPSTRFNQYDIGS